MDDQQAFAELSGDRNPLHLDPIMARRSMIGGAAVHGVHLLLWALDQLSTQRSLRNVARLRVHFDRGVPVGKEVSVTWREEDGRLVGRLAGEAGTLVRITLVPGKDVAEAWTGSTEAPALACEDYAMSALVGRSGEVALALPQSWTVQFPNLAGQFSPRTIAALLASTRLVGMICPGLHSIYSALQLDSATGVTSKTALHYEVIRADSRVRLVDMAISGAGLSGIVNTFLRPPPYVQPALATLMHKVAPNAFAGQRAFIIGGSRGLGELAAKLLAAGGAAVTITWRQGKTEAGAIAAEATALGLSIATLPFDVAAPPQDAPAAMQYTHLYYFATPRISAGRPGRFEVALFATMLETYVTGLARCAAWFVPRSVPNGCIWYPSTVLIERPEPNFSEYAAAKSCGEALCAQISNLLAPRRAIVERLPRMPTDQTQALTELPMTDAATTLYAALLRSVGNF